MTRNFFLTSLVIFLGFLFLLGPVNAVDAIFTNWRGIAIAGYDPVAYFAKSGALEGNSDFTVKWKGAKWRFASSVHRDLFKTSPEKFSPKYGGYCAYGVSLKKVANSDPNAWSIVDGNLYLNSSESIIKSG